VGAFADLVARLTGQEAPAQPGVVLPSVPTADDLRVALADVTALVGDPSVPGAVTARVLRVVDAVHAGVDRLDRLGAGSEQAYVVMATATNYLPDAVRGYLRLPRDWASSRPVDGRRTALMVLVDQLDLLAATMDQVLDAVHRADAAALVTHGRFLAEKFASTPTALTLGAVPPAPTASTVPPVAVAAVPTAPGPTGHAAGAGPDPGVTPLRAPDGAP
jgi:hypothetical protein